MEKISSLFSKIKDKGIKHIITETIPEIMCDKLDKYVTAIVKRIYINKPIKNVIILESHNDFDSNGGAFYEYLLQNGYNKRYKIVWFLRNKCPKNLPHNVESYRYNRLSVKRVYYHCIARYILSEHYAIPAIRDGQIAIFMRHGAGGLKNAAKFIALPGGIQYILGLSKKYAPIENLQKLFTNENQKIIYLGFPSHDYLFKNNDSELKKITKNKYKKTILWMPTFRKGLYNRNDSNVELPLGIPLFKNIEEYKKLNELLIKLDCLLIVKIHPMQDLSTLKIKGMSNIRVITGEDVKKINVDNYKLMSCCDAMISDYSGAAYDFLQIDRPIAYVLSDMQEYKIGFVVEDIHTLIGGKEIYTLDDMFDFIRDTVNGKDEFKEKRRKVRDFIYTYHDENNSCRLAEFLGLKK